MPSFFEELGLLDRPFVSFEVKLGNKPAKFQARSLSGKQSDELEALQMDEYARILSKLTEAEPGSISELARVRRVYEASQMSDLAKQMLATRETDVVVRAMELAGLDFREEAAKLEALPEDEREAYAKAQDERYEAARTEAKAEITKEIEAQPIDKIAKQLSEVTINIRAQRMAQRAFNDLFLYYALYQPEGTKPCFESREQVSEDLSAKTIELLVTEARKALSTDLPFESPAADEPVKQPSSPDTSAAATEAGGTPTPTTPDA